MASHLPLSALFIRCEVSDPKDDLEKAILAVYAIHQLLADEPTHSDEVEAELSRLQDLLRDAHDVLVRARRRFEQLSPRSKSAMRLIHLRFRHILVDLALALGVDE